jgi:hypothetical protein
MSNKCVVWGGGRFICRASELLQCPWRVGSLRVDQTAATNNHLPMPEMWPSSLSWCTAQACGYIREPPESARQVYTTWLACTASVDPSKRAPHLNARTARYGQRLTAGLAEPVPRAIAVDCPSSVYFRIRKQENGQQINDISLGKLSHK